MTTLHRTKETTIDVFRNTRTNTYLSLFGFGITQLIDIHSGKSTNHNNTRVLDVWWDITKNPLRTQSYYKFTKNDMPMLYKYMTDVIWPKELSDYKSELKHQQLPLPDHFRDSQLKEIRRIDKSIEKLKEVMNAKYEIVTVNVKKDVTTVITTTEDIVGPV